MKIYKAYKPLNNQYMKNCKNRISTLLVVGFFLTTTQIKSQSLANMPQVIPPSPVAETFAIYGNYPVSNNTGVPDIQIPLYNFKCGDIELPIVLKYHIGSAKPSPYKVEMSNVGYGWILEAGGLVTRTIMGRQDESEKLPTDSIDREFDETLFSDWDLLSAISSRGLDSEFDIFSYNFFSNNGNFIIEKNTTTDIFAAYTFPYKPLKFDFVLDTLSQTSTLIGSVKIRDDNGYNYTFSDPESNTFLNTGWFLSKIKSPTNRQMNFLYNDRSLRRINDRYVSVYRVKDYYPGYLVSGLQVPSYQPENVDDIYPTSLVYDTKVIHEINSDSAKIEFTYTEDNSLIDFFIVSYAGKQIVKVVFHRSKFPGQNLYERLDYLDIQDLNSEKVQRYSFQYDTNSVLNSEYVDYWGWYNGVSGSKHIPATAVEYMTVGNDWTESSGGTLNIGANDACVNSTMILAQTLKKISYPTGGSTEFEFEPNHYYEEQSCSVSYGAGLRIKSIINKDDDNVVTIKTYEYQPGFLKFSRFNQRNYTHFSYSLNAYCIWSPFLGYTLTRFRTISEEMNPELLDVHVKYNAVTEYFGTNIANVGKNIYTYTFDNDHYYLPACGGEEYNFNYYIPSEVINQYKDWGNGRLTSVETYKRKTDNTDTIVKRTTYLYRLFNTESFLNLKVFRLCSYPGSYQCSNINVFSEREVRNLVIEDWDPSIGFETPPPIYFTYKYYIQTGGYVPIRTIETQYFPEPVSVSTRYDYDSTYKKYVTKEVLLIGAVDSVTTTFKYPYDYSDSVYTSMVDSNEINHVVEITKNRNGSIETTKTNYHDWGAKIIKPITIQTGRGSNPIFDTRITYHDIDTINHGNVLSVSKEDDIDYTYVWGYNQTYPVAKIVGGSSTYISPALRDFINNHVYCETDTISTIDADISFLKTQLSSYISDMNYQVTLYTYKPLVGMTSQTDPNGITTYYEYDSFGRLEYIRDKNQNILKYIDYHYQTQNGD